MPKFEPSLLDDIRARVPISEVIGPNVTWTKKSRPSVGDYWACCPAHGEKSPSFHCEDKKGRYHCFGCGISGDHFKFLTDWKGLTFPQAVAEIASMAGIQLPDAKPLTEAQKAANERKAQERAAAEIKRRSEEESKKAERVMSAGLIWRQTKPLKGTLAEQYLEWRCPGLCPQRESELRFHPGLELDPEHPRDELWPVLVARVSDAAGKGIAVWRIYLTHEGLPLRNKEGKKIKLGYGPSAGGAIRLGGLSKMIGLAEGIETSLAVKRLGFTSPVWSALSTSGMVGFKIPEGVERIILFPDPDGNKLKTKYKNDGTSFVSQPPGREACRKFMAANPGHAISVSDMAMNADFLEILQKSKGVPVR